MTHLNIQQGSGVEIVSALIINKLYDTALTVSEPLEGETDAAYMSGNLLVTKASKKRCDYLTNRFHNLHINATQGYYIDFEDPALELALISAGISSDGFGITETDAANAVLYQEDLVSLKNTLTTFNEFNKFTTSNGGGYNFTSRFKDFTNLTSINLTELKYLNKEDFYNTGITIVNAPNLLGLGYLNGDSVFLECSDLTTVLSLGNLSNIPNKCFKNCTSLTSVNLPNSVTEIKESAFENCTSLSQIDFSNITILGKASFKNCTSLTGDISLPSLISLGQTAFNGCSGITSISNLGLVQEIRDDNGGYSWGAFYSCTNLREIIFPTTLRTFTFDCINENTLVHKFIFSYGLTKITNMPSNMKSRVVNYIQMPSTITSLNLVAMNFYLSLDYISMYIVIQATTPPSTNYANNGNSFNSRNYVGYPEYSRWYVPDANLNDYKTDSEWSSIASSIFPISLLQTDNPTWWAVYQDNKDYGVPSQS